MVREVDNVILLAQAGDVRWSAEAKRCVLSCRWKDEEPLQKPFRSGFGQCARNQLSEPEEQLFGEEVNKWINNGLLVEHDPAMHGEVATVLPLLAKVQEHKSSTPVQPCLPAAKPTDRITPGADVRPCVEVIKRLIMRHSDDGRLHWRSKTSLPETQEDETSAEPQLAKRSGMSITEEYKRKSKVSKDSHPTSETTKNSIPFEKPVKI